MKASLLLCLSLACFQITSFAQFPGYIQNDFQSLLDSIETHHQPIGLSVAVRNASSEWTGVQGISTATDPINSEHKFAMGSVSKTITAATILQMHDEGLLDLDDEVGTHLGLVPWVTPTITIRQLLNHTSGIYNYTNHPNQSADVFYNSQLLITPQYILSNYMSSGPFSPGTDWGYSNTNYMLLGMIIDTLSGQEYYEEARDRFSFNLDYPSMSLPPHESSTDDLAHLWIDTIGNGSAFDVQASPMSTNALFSGAGAAGAYVSTPSDLAQWAYDLYSGNLLQSATFQQMIDSVPNSGGYGLGVMVRTTSCGLTYYGHTGGIFYRSATFYSPDLDLAVSAHVNDANAIIHLENLVQEIFCRYEILLSDDIEVLANSEVKAFPNPFTSGLSISWPELSFSPTQLTITNLAGSVVHSSAINSVGSTSLNLGEELQAGIYFLQLATDKQSAVVRLIKAE